MKSSVVQLGETLNIPRSTLDRQIRQKEPLRDEHAERVLGLMALIGQVEAMVQESGEPDGFDAAAWVQNWIETANPALGGQPPKALMKSVTGQTVVSDLLAQMQSGAYA